MKNTKILLTLLLLSASGISFAEDKKSTDYGLTFGISYNYSQNKFDNDFKKASGSGFGLSASYNLLKPLQNSLGEQSKYSKIFNYFELPFEVSYRYLNASSKDVYDDGTDIYNTSYKVTNLGLTTFNPTLVLARDLYIFKTIKAYGKLGLGYTSSYSRVSTGGELVEKEKLNYTAFAYGAGIDFQVHDRLSVGFDYTGVQLKDVDNDLQIFSFVVKTHV